MTEQELENIINDHGKSDQDVFEAIKEYTADDPNVKFKIIPIATQDTETLEAYKRLSTLTLRLRPRAMELLRKFITEQHGDCGCTTKL